jgi:H/ACA ribonucleoprotein complex subunit 2
MKCADQRKLVFGVKDTGKVIKNSGQGICVLGGNVSPMDVITHIPALCESQSVPYVFLPTKEQISAYAQRILPVACALILKPEEDAAREDYDAVVAEIRSLAQ